MAMHTDFISFKTHDRRHVSVHRENDTVRVGFPLKDDRDEKEFALTAFRDALDVDLDHKTLLSVAHVVALRCETDNDYRDADDDVRKALCYNYFDLLRSLL